MSASLCVHQGKRLPLEEAISVAAEVHRPRRLPALEKLAEAWAQELDPSWIEAKQAISDKSVKDKNIPDYLGISSIEELFYLQPQSTLDDIRARAEKLLDFCRSASEGQSTSVLDRVSTVFVGRAEL